MLDINKQEMKYSQSGQMVFIPQTDKMEILSMKGTRAPMENLYLI